MRCFTEVEMYRADPTGNQLGLPWGKGAYWEYLRPLLGRLKRALRVKQRLSVEEFNQLLQLSEAITDYGRMIQAYNQFPVPNVIVEIPELAHRFRETPQTIQDALGLLRDVGRAEPAELSGCWILRLAGTPPGGREGVHSTTRHSHTNIEKPKPPYVRPQLSRLSLAEARTKLQAELIPGDAIGQEMLRRIEQFVRETCQGI